MACLASMFLRHARPRNNGVNHPPGCVLEQRPIDAILRRKSSRCALKILSVPSLKKLRRQKLLAWPAPFPHAVFHAE